MASSESTLRFEVDPRVPELGVRGIYLVISGLQNRESDTEFQSISQEAVGRVRDSNIDPKQDPVLAGFRELHTAVGRSNRDYPASPEMLVKQLTRFGTIPRVNLLVDIYNTVSIETRLALGAHDVTAISGGTVALGLTTGEELFHPIGSPEPKPVFPGEYAYMDSTREIICRMEVRQVEKTKVTTDSSSCFYILQGNPNTPNGYIADAAERLVSLTSKYCGGVVTNRWVV
jgi:DNA/RNA-binding domain of Phe-tRNA-synthetase-like protein